MYMYIYIYTRKCRSKNLPIPIDDIFKVINGSYRVIIIRK